MTKKAIIYCRVASMMQKKDSSLEQQKMACIRFAKSKGYEVTNIVCEQGSGLRINQQLQKVLNEVKSGSVKTIIASNIDRLSRSVVLAVKTLKELEKNNVRIRFANDSNNTENSLTESILENSANTYRSLLNERIKRGIAQKKKEIMVAQSK